MMREILIDPTHLNHESALVLEHLAEHLKKNHILEMNTGTEYPLILDTLDNKKIEYRIRLTHTLIYRQKINSSTHRTEARYSVLGDRCLGSGNYGGVYEVLGTLAPLKDQGFHYKTNKQRVTKIQQHPDKESLEEALKEAELSRMAAHLHAKYITVIEKENQSATSYLVMRRFEGETLIRLLASDQAEINPLSTEKRLLLSINLLRALQEQVHDFGLIHRDIKPENILVDPETCEVYIIDYGLGRKANKDDHHYCGSRKYAPPEAIGMTGKMDEASDRFSLGLVLGLVWRSEIRKPDEIEKSTEKNYQPEFENLFHNINDLQINEQTKIKMILRCLTAYKKSSRGSSQWAIDLFDAIYLERKLRTLPPNETTDVQSAHMQAMAAREALKKIRVQEKNILDCIQEVIDNTMDHIPSSLYALNELIETIGIQAFNDLKNQDKEAVKQRTQSILTEFVGHLNTMLDMLDVVEKNSWFLNFDPTSEKSNHRTMIRELYELFRDIDVILNKQNRREITLDNLVTLNARFKSEIPAFQLRLANLTHAIETGPYPVHMQSYNRIMHRLKMTDQLDKLSCLRNNIRQAIKSYIQSTLLPETIAKPDRAGSDDRLDCIQKILNYTDEISDVAMLTQSLRSSLKTMKTGLFGTSRLRKNIKQAIHAMEQSHQHSNKL
ncbi:serine/threonine-protein kinase [Aquicella lusitana]|uniref:Serine/threonine protein kinase n=1 Tax=Aquicella lusitana TaxID=254246 RepID=A0A370GXU3_9COXI|nr:protein kinase [Aquicella lusitana]RDI48096.1 serine/threonine protein kinase [Aquicella lusitana]VVC72888.1 Serine/threonine-protein kinase PrkC [Aquicella lusitana]